jgi:hypothetical protein
MFKYFYSLLLLLFLCVWANSAEIPKFIFKEGNTFAAFDLQQGKAPCKKNFPCLFFHKDSDNLRLIIDGKNIRMAYKSEDNERMPFPKNFRTMSFQEKSETVKNYRDFFRSELALMLQAFVYTAPELFDWDVEKFKAAQNSFLISEKELDGIFSGGIAPKFYTVMKFKCKGGENVVFESDANGNFFMEVK